MKPTYSLFLFTYCCVHLVCGQVYPISKLSVKEGLPEYTVNKIAQDQLGYMWFGTGRGLARYDGYEVKKFDQSNGFVSAWVTDIEIDANGWIWISTDGAGLYIYNGLYFQHFNSTNGLPSDHLFDLLLCEDEIYIATMDTGVVHINQQRQAYCINTTTDDLPVHVALKLLRRKNGNILVASIDGMFELAQNNPHELRTLYKEGRVYSMFEKADQSILFGSAGNLNEMDAKGISVHPLFENEIHEVIVKDICEDGPLLWLASNNGLYKISGKTIEHIGKENGLSSNTLKDVFKDGGGKIWMGSDNAGANCIDATGIRHFYFSKEEQPLVTYSLAEDSLDRMLFFTSQYGVAVYDGVNCTAYPALQNLPTNILSSFRAADQSIWLTSVTGSISHLSKGKDILNKQVINLPGLYVVHMAPYNADTIVLSTSEGIYLMDSHTMEASILSELPSVYFRSCFIDQQKTIWALGDAGEIYTYNRGNVKDLTALINPQHYILTQGYVDPVSQLYFFGTSYGLIVWDGQHQILLNANNGLHGDHINSITMDSLGYIWVGHNKGVEMLDLQKKKTRFLGYYQGFHPMETNTTVAYTDSKGIIWFGTVESASSINVNELEQDTLVPAVMIEEIEVNDHSYYHLDIGQELAKELYLHYNENNLEFKFKSLNYFSSKEMMYEWKLEGFDKNWKTATTQIQVNYTNLKPGSYEFLVKAINTDGYESVVTRLTIEIRKPFWQTIWFYMIEFFIVALVVILSFVFSKDPSKSRFANITTLLSIFIVFETALFYVSAYTDKYTHGIPIFQIVLNIILAMSLQPLEQMIKKIMFKFSKYRSGNDS